VLSLLGHSVVLVSKTLDGGFFWWKFDVGNFHENLLGNSDFQAYLSIRKLVYMGQ